MAAANHATQTSSSDTRATAITGTTDVAPATSEDAADNASKAGHAAAEEGPVGDGKEE